MDIFLRLATAGLIPLAMGIFTAPSPDSSVLMEEMTFTEVRDAIRRGKTTVLIFNGSTEASGQHLALGKHVYRARYLGERIARELGNALVAPVMPFAPTTDEMRFAGTINLSRGTFSRVNEEVADNMMRAGFKYVILMGDHGGNQAPLKALAPKLDAKYRSQGVRVFYSSDAYLKSDREIEAYLMEHGFVRPPRQDCRGWSGAVCWQSSGTGRCRRGGRSAQVFSENWENVYGVESQECGRRNSRADPELNGA